MSIKELKKIVREAKEKMRREGKELLKQEFAVKNVTLGEYDGATE
jgi:hypothetical protein